MPSAVRSHLLAEALSRAEARAATAATRVLLSRDRANGIGAPLGRWSPVSPGESWLAASWVLAFTAQRRAALSRARSSPRNRLLHSWALLWRLAGQHRSRAAAWASMGGPTCRCAGDGGAWASGLPPLPRSPRPPSSGGRVRPHSCWFPLSRRTSRDRNPPPTRGDCGNPSWPSVRPKLAQGPPAQNWSRATTTWTSRCVCTPKTTSTTSSEPCTLVVLTPPSLLSGSRSVIARPATRKTDDTVTGHVSPASSYKVTTFLRAWTVGGRRRGPAERSL